MSAEYFERVRKRLSDLQWLIKRERIDVEWDEDANVGMVGGRIRFMDGSIFHFRDVILGEERHYRYHYMDEENSLIYRWDTAPHHKEVDTFPYHLHLPDGVKACEEVDLIDALDEIERNIVERIET